MSPTSYSGNNTVSYRKKRTFSWILKSTSKTFDKYFVDTGGKIYFENKLQYHLGVGKIFRMKFGETDETFEKVL